MTGKAAFTSRQRLACTREAGKSDCQRLYS
jgi:hypothetical protein